MNRYYFPALRSSPVINEASVDLGLILTAIGNFNKDPTPFVSSCANLIQGLMNNQAQVTPRYSLADTTSLNSLVSESLIGKMVAALRHATNAYKDCTNQVSSQRSIQGALLRSDKRSASRRRTSAILLQF